MKLYLSSRHIAALKDFSTSERLMIISLAIQQMPVPQKMLLNVLKLGILTPLFLALAKVEGWDLLYYLVPAVLLYPIVTRPITLTLCAPFIDSAIENYNKIKAQ